MIKKLKSVVRKNVRSYQIIGNYDESDLIRFKHYSIPESFYKRFYIFTADVFNGYYYQTVYSDKYGIVTTEYFSIKCEAFSLYIKQMNINTISDIKNFISFLNELVDFRLNSIANWNKTDVEILKENETTKKGVRKICDKYIRQVKIKKILK